MSAANAAVDHIHNLFLGTKEGHHVAMAVWSDGNPYGIEDGIFYSFPVKCKNGEWQFVDGIKNNTSRGSSSKQVNYLTLMPYVYVSSHSSIIII